MAGSIFGLQWLNTRKPPSAGADRGNAALSAPKKTCPPRAITRDAFPIPDVDELAKRLCADDLEKYGGAAYEISDDQLAPLMAFCKKRAQAVVDTRLAIRREGRKSGASITAMRAAYARLREGAEGHAARVNIDVVRAYLAFGSAYSKNLDRVKNFGRRRKP